MADLKYQARPLFRLVTYGSNINPWVKIFLFLIATTALVLVTFFLLPLLNDIGPLGYAAAFFVNAFSSASVILPGPGFGAIIVMARDLNWFYLGLAAGIGGTFGELTGYWLGMQGHDSLEKSRVYRVMEIWMERFGGGFLFSAGVIPIIPIDVAGIIAGATRYPVWRFLVSLGVGKVIKTTAVLYLAAKAFEWAEPYLELFG
ncbi:MAG: hypothetical protein FJ319_08385 [SAR202 cluster bacterium]|nr:hypothetical protein [SAR202 cluster bacterium]